MSSHKRKLHPGASCAGVAAQLAMLMQQPKVMKSKGPDVRIIAAPSKDGDYTFGFKRLSHRDKTVWLHAITLSKEAVWAMQTLVKALESA